MKVIFLHNRYDSESWALLNELQNDPSVTVDVVDVFKYPPPEIPTKIRPTKLPAFFTKKLVLLEPSSLNVVVSPTGVLTIRLGCYDLNDRPIGDESETRKTFYVYINGMLFNDSPSIELIGEKRDTPIAVLTFELVVEPNKQIHLRVEVDEYIPFDEVFTVVAG